MNLHKYSDIGRLAHYAAGNIRFTQAPALNDPYEVRPHVTGVPHINGHPIPADVFTKVMYKVLGANTGILSLASRYDNLLMWSHYAENHKGVCVEIDIGRTGWVTAVGAIVGQFDHLHCVKYSQVRPSKPLVDLDFQDLFLTKSAEWGYEEEFRILKVLSEKDKIIDSESSYPIHLFPFPHSSIKVVRFGAQVSDEEVISSKANFADPAFGHIQYYRARLVDREFKLEFLPV